MPRKEVHIGPSASEQHHGELGIRRTRNDDPDGVRIFHPRTGRLELLRPRRGFIPPSERTNHKTVSGPPLPTGDNLSSRVIKVDASLHQPIIEQATRLSPLHATESTG
ncbi:hypothetical protein [Streptomyces sp. NPDC055189]